MGLFDGKDTSDDIMNSYKRTYDTDKDLTPEERRKIQFARDPAAMRRNIWKNKSAGSKIMRMFNSAMEGDMRAEEE